MNTKPTNIKCKFISAILNTNKAARHREIFSNGII